MKQYHYLFGPVRSRRLGLSLGVDLVPHKTCTLDCVYCECGKTTRLITKPQPFIPVEEITSELDDLLSAKPKLDSITFSGSGEPTLHSGIGEVIEHLKHHHSSYQVTVITNGTLLWKEEVRKALLRADRVIPSLDSVIQETFARMLRPAAGITAALVQEGIRQFRQVYTGELVIEIFLAPGINTTGAELLALKKACDGIRPDRIQLNSLDRPGTEAWLEPVKHEELSRIAEVFAPFAVDVPGLRRDAAHKGTERSINRDALLGLLRRRPSTVQDIETGLNVVASDLMPVLEELIMDQTIQSSTTDAGTFYFMRSF